jgi:hypothetical protein
LDAPIKDPSFLETREEYKEDFTDDDVFWVHF